MLHSIHSHEVGIEAQAADLHFTLCRVRTGDKTEANWSFVIQDTSELPEDKKEAEIILTDNEAGAIMALFVVGDFSSESLTKELYDILENSEIKNLPRNLRPIP